MATPKVSIIMSTYNDSKYIGGAIESVLKQTFKNWELIIVNDASYDDTDALIQKYAKRNIRLRYLKNRVQKGLYPNINRAIKISKGKLIARLDSDDEWIDKNKLKKQVSFMDKNRDCGLVGTGAIAVSENEEKLFTIKYNSGDKDIRKRLLVENCFVHSSVVFRKDFAIKKGLYDPKVGYPADYDLWLKIGTVAKLNNLPALMVKYRVHAKTMSRENYASNMESVLSLIKKFRYDYPNYTKGKIMWQIRKYYPLWFRQRIVNQLKNRFSNVNR